jgi:hypothetical protein
MLVCAIDDSIFCSVGSLPNLLGMLTVTAVESGDSTSTGVTGWNP